MFKDYNRVIRALILVSLAAIGLSGCSSILSVAAIDDPYESVNRKVHGFNKALDKHFIRPVSTGYTAIVPPEFQVLVNNFSDNLSLPAIVVNKLLQGEIPDAASNAARFAVNTTLGLAGLFDPSASYGLLVQETDFGETLHVWNAPQGDYLELPVLGPSTERAALGTLVDTFTNPLGYQLNSKQQVYRDGAKAASILSLRSQYGSAIDAMLYDSADSYTQSRLIYLQNRNYSLGGVDEMDYDDPDLDPFGDDDAE
jgi:phospholipid-binding lipoprotein MlaA